MIDSSASSRRSAAPRERRALEPISEIRTTVVNLRLVAPYRWVSGFYPGSTKVVVEVETANGLVGLGEASNWRHAQLIDEEIAPRLRGCDAMDLPQCWQAAVPPVAIAANTESPEAVRAYGAVEIALWDIRARHAELPLYQLLGGAWRRRVPFTEYFAFRQLNGSEGGESSPEDVAAYCERMVEEHGSTAFEGKVGFSDPETDLEIVRQVRRAIGPKRMLRLDANMGWRRSTAQHLLQAFVAHDVAAVEDPGRTYEDFVALRRHSAIPFSTHLADLPRAVQLGVPDSFALNLTALGGLERTRRFIASCEAMGVGFSFYSGETGIGVAAYLHLGTSDPHLWQPSQSLLRWYANDVIVGGPFVPVEGFLEAPEGPGLGVELDRARLRDAHRDFVEHGPLDPVAAAPGQTGYLHPPLY